MKKFEEFFFLNEEKQQPKLKRTLDFVSQQKKVLLICTSNRWEGSDDVPKSTRLAQFVQQAHPGICTVIDASKLQIFDCEGNVSDAKGNHCGVKAALLKDKEKNPSGLHRCWCSLNHKEDELWKITKELFESSAVIFFGSIRWGQTNAVLQRLLERLTWIENAQTTLGEKNPVKGISAGTILIGQNWNGKEVVSTQKQVLEFFGFETPKEISWNWQFTSDASDESKESYIEAPKRFREEFLKRI